MKHFAAALILFIISMLEMTGTPQTPERIMIDGREWSLKVFPLYSLGEDDYRKVENLLLENHAWSMGCTRGYIGHWSISGGRLYLKGLEMLNADNLPFGFVPDGLEFSDKFIPASEIACALGMECTAEGLHACWFTGTANAGTGEVIFEERHMKYYETETDLQIKNGIVTSSETFSNGLFKEGLSIKDALGHVKDRITAEIKSGRFGTVTGGRTVFLISGISINRQGHFNGCTVKVISPWTGNSGNLDQDRLALRINELISGAGPLELYRINGRTRCRYDNSTWTMSIYIPESSGNTDPMKNKGNRPD